MNVLLIYPEIPDTFWSFKHAIRFISKKASLPPLGLLTVAAMLPPEWNKRLVDANVKKLTDGDLTWADYVFISAMVLQRESARQIIVQCKKKGVKVVAGGPLFTIEHEQFEEVDYFMLNEAELTLPSFLEDLKQECARHIYTTTEFPNLQKTPVPQWDLIDLDQYVTMPLQFSRGCPYDCEFCDVTALFGHRPRTKNAEQIINELNSLYDLGWRTGVFFVDDNLIGNKRALRDELLPALIKWRKDKRGMSFSTQVSLNLVNDEQLIRMMVKAGFNAVFVGIETPNENSLAECGKVQNRNRNMVEDVKILQRAGLQVQGGFIVGFDHDTASIFQRQIDFIQKSGIVTAMVGLLQAPLGTRLYQRLKREGRLCEHEQMSGDNVDGTTNIIPKMGIDTLHKGYKRILETIYSPEHYYQRVKTFLQEYRPSKIKIPLNFAYDLTYVLAFFRSIYHLGIIGKERVYYWKLLLWTLFRRPQSFPLAIILAIYGYHFRKVCELHVQ